MTINPKQSRFVDEYLVDLNATQAAIRAGYSAATAYSQGQRLLKHVEVAAEIAKRRQKITDKLELTAEGVVAELAKIGFSDLRKAFDDEGRLLPPGQWPDDFALAVSSVEVVTRSLPGEGDDELDAQPHGGALARRRNPKVEYVHKLRLWDKRAALVDLGKHLGMFKTAGDSPDNPLHVKVPVLNVTIGSAGPSSSREAG